MRRGTRGCGSTEEALTKMGAVGVGLPERRHLCGDLGHRGRWSMKGKGLLRQRGELVQRPRRQQASETTLAGQQVRLCVPGR